MRNKNKEHTNYIGVRVTDEEKEILQREADRLKCSISEAIRRCVRRRFGPAASGISGTEQKRSLQMEASFVRLEFKKIATDYHNFVTNLYSCRNRSLWSVDLLAVFNGAP